MNNRKGIFTDVDHGLDGRRRALADRFPSRFPRYALDVVGGVALFAGWTG